MDIDTLKQKIRELVDKARDKFDALVTTERDRRALLLGGSAIVVVVIYLVFHSYSSGVDNLQKRYAQLENDKK